MKTFRSPNFAFLEKHSLLLVKLAASAEKYLFDDPAIAVFKLGQFGELLAQEAAARAGIPVLEGDNQSFIVGELKVRKIISPEIADLFHELRISRNVAAHDLTKEFTRSDALYRLRMARNLAIWFHRVFGRDPKFNPGAFLPPPEPEDVTEALSRELEELRAAFIKREEELTAVKKTKQELETKAKSLYEDLSAALELAEETENQRNRAVYDLSERLSALQAVAETQPKYGADAYVQAAKEASSDYDINEADTRKIIDTQLRKAGWEVDTVNIRYEKGVRPQKGKALAIAEWPTDNGPADYVLFVGLKPLAIVEAKRFREDISDRVLQSKRYSKGFDVAKDMLLPGGPWDECKVPFLFATNGRAYLKQLEQKSGIWFLDARRSTNHPRALQDWYSPEGLTALLGQDIEAAEEKLRTESKEYLDVILRDYQKRAISAVEQALTEGNNSLLVAMATGTGKTRLCVCLVYRLIKAKRSRRALFLVDRNTLGGQALDCLKDVKLENYQSFTDIYDVKEMGDLVPEETTKIHVATVQSVIRRVLYPSDGIPSLPVDSYDLIIIDECHRGYTLDREMTEGELVFRSEEDFVSKYRRVLEYFDATKIGLTATPALHTVEIFGKPVFTYSYPEAVIDGWLRDYDPPIRITTKLGRDGITWEAGSEVTVYKQRSKQLDIFTTPDEVHIDIEDFNKRVITPPFNQAVCRELARHIDPTLPGKTLVFCVDNTHADLVVTTLKEAFEEAYGPLEDDTVVKITSKSDKPLQLFKKYQNDRLPSVAVTVDYLTTGIDVEEIVNLVFIRRVKSRILYEQMLGRATRNCDDLFGPGEHKESFRIFDAVDVYASLEDFNTMKPVTVSPSITLEELLDYLAGADNAEYQEELFQQIVVKVRRKLSRLKGARSDKFQDLAGQTEEDFVRDLRAKNPKDVLSLFKDDPALVQFLDSADTESDPAIFISEHPDEVVSVEHGFGPHKRPEDYLDGFKRFIDENINKIPALLLVTTKPRDLTRKQLKEIRLLLEKEGFTENRLKKAYGQATNHEIAASIIGYIRRAALGAPLVPYDERVSQAMKRIYALHQWTSPQRDWLRRIEKQLRAEVVVDKESIDGGQFQASGGFNRLNKVFEGKLEQVLGEISEELWNDKVVA